MGLIDTLLMSPEQFWQAEKIVTEINAGVEKALARRNYPTALAVPVDIERLVGEELEWALDSATFSIDEMRDEIIVRLDRLSEGIAALRTDFNWAMEEVIWKLEMIGQQLISIVEILQAPISTQAKELRKRAEFAYLNGWYDEALQDFTESARVNYQDFTVHRSLGNIYFYHFRDLNKALDCYRKAAKYARPHSNSQSAEAHLLAAWVLTHRNNLREAIIELWEAAKLDPKLLEAHYQLARCYAQLNDIENAKKNLRWVIWKDLGYLYQAELDPVFEGLQDFISEQDQGRTEIMELKEEQANQFLSTLNISTRCLIIPFTPSAISMARNMGGGVEWIPENLPLIDVIKLAAPYNMELSLDLKTISLDEELKYERGWYTKAITTKGGWIMWLPARKIRQMGPRHEDDEILLDQIESFEEFLQKAPPGYRFLDDGTRAMGYYLITLLRKRNIDLFAPDDVNRVLGAAMSEIIYFDSLGSPELGGEWLKNYRPDWHELGLNYWFSINFHQGFILNHLWILIPS